MANNMTHIEKYLIDFIDKWINETMKYFVDIQYGKGEFKKILSEVKHMIEERAKVLDTGINTYPGDGHIIPLMPCPKCGGNAQFVENTIDMVYDAECTVCGISLCGYSSRLDLCNDWNTRAEK